MKRLLLHACCAPDATYAIEFFSPDWDITLYFCNSNIHPETEYRKRNAAARTVAEHFSIPLLEEQYVPHAWHEAVQGLEQEPEKGRRCERCFSFLLSHTAQRAVSDNFQGFATTLTISPHKDAALINRIGTEQGRCFGIPYRASDLKKKDGFKRSLVLSKELGLYRQNYCGCIYSISEKKP